MSELPDRTRKDLYTRNGALATELFGVCPVCGSLLAKTYDGEVGRYYNVVCPEGHDRRMVFSREERKWKPENEETPAA